MLEGYFLAAEARLAARQLEQRAHEEPSAQLTYLGQAVEVTRWINTQTVQIRFADGRTRMVRAKVVDGLLRSSAVKPLSPEAELRELVRPYEAGLAKVLARHNPKPRTFVEWWKGLWQMPGIEIRTVGKDTVFDHGVRVYYTEKGWRTMKTTPITVGVTGQPQELVGYGHEWERPSPSLFSYFDKSEIIAHIESLLGMREPGPGHELRVVRDGPSATAKV